MITLPGPDPVLEATELYARYIELTEIASLAEMASPEDDRFGYTPPPLGIVFAG